MIINKTFIGELLANLIQEPKHPQCTLNITYVLIYRMFTTFIDLKPNTCGEYEVAKGVSAPMFRAILVSHGVISFVTLA